MGRVSLCSLLPLSSVQPLAPLQKAVGDVSDKAKDAAKDAVEGAKDAAKGVADTVAKVGPSGRACLLWACGSS